MLPSRLVANLVGRDQTGSFLAIDDSSIPPVRKNLQIGYGVRSTCVKDQYILWNK